MQATTRLHHQQKKKQNLASDRLLDVDLCLPVLGVSIRSGKVLIAQGVFLHLLMRDVIYVSERYDSGFLLLVGAINASLVAVDKWNH